VNRLGGTGHGGGPFRLNIAKVKVPLTAVLVAWVAGKIAAGFGWLIRHPLALAPVVLVLGFVRVFDVLGPLPIAATVLLAAGGLVAWRVLWPEMFTTQVVWRLRGLWRGRWPYRFTWQPAMVTTGLAVLVDGREYLPKIRSVKSTGSVDLVRVRMLPGQTIEDWAEAAPRLAQTFDAQECRVRSTEKRQQLCLWFLVIDPLTQPVEPFEPHSVGTGVDLAAVPVARREDGLGYRMRLLGTHLLVVGATGSGKGSVIWSLVNGIAPAIRDGLAQVWALDPKGGMELAGGRSLFARFVYGDPDEATTPLGEANPYEFEFAKVLEDAVKVMRKRQGDLRGITRLHTPTVAEPLIVVVVDELASLTAYVTDREAKKRIQSALSLLLSQGRAVGVSVVGAVQDPRKEVLSFRDLFPTRVALRLSESDQVGLVLGQGARDRGALCDRISESLPGVGYVGIDGIAEPVRVRFTHVTDAHIADLGIAYAPGSVIPGEVTNEVPDGMTGGRAA
jgi:S-DNA-T family DNA segregation ATPase FtsK/SpoIIIE